MQILREKKKIGATGVGILTTVARAADRVPGEIAIPGGRVTVSEEGRVLEDVTVRETVRAMARGMGEARVLRIVRRARIALSVRRNREKLVRRGRVRRVLNRVRR